jgi:ribose transport system substrate-binding protein
MRERMTRLGMLLLMAAVTVGCPGRNTPGTPTPGAPGAKALKLAFVINGASEFWTYARAGCSRAQAEQGNLEVDFQVPSDATASEQKRIVDDLLARGIDGMAISPIDPANQTALLNQVASQALLFTHDSDAPESNRACYIGTDNVAAGRQAGELIKKVLPEGGKIMVFVGTLDALNAKERAQGIKESLAGSKVEIIDIRADGTDRVRAKANVQDTIVKYPDIACLVGLWSYNGPAILNAVKDSGKTGKIKIVCFDEEDETLAGVKSGAIFGTIVQQPYEFGYQSITLMARHLRGDPSVIPATKQIFVPTIAVQKENVDEFSRKLKELLGR